MKRKKKAPAPRGSGIWKVRRARAEARQVIQGRVRIMISFEPATDRTKTEPTPRRPRRLPAVSQKVV